MTKTRTIEMLVLLSLLLFLSVSQPASAQPADGGSSGTATEENTAPSQESQRASALAAQSKGIPERNPNCDKQGKEDSEDKINNILQRFVTNFPVLKGYF